MNNHTIIVIMNIEILASFLLGFFTYLYTFFTRQFSLQSIQFGFHFFTDMLLRQERLWKINYIVNRRIYETYNQFCGNISLPLDQTLADLQIYF